MFFHDHMAVIACSRINSNSLVASVHIQISFIVSEVTFITGLFKSGSKQSLYVAFGW